MISWRSIPRTNHQSGASLAIPFAILVFNMEENIDSDQPTISQVFFTREKVIKAIDMLEAEAAACPDGVPALLIKKLKDILANPITELGNKSMEEGVFP